MIPHEQNDAQLLIRCPECKQRFKVKPELRDRTVECGICEHRFRIHDDVIVRVRKFYPGESRKRGLDRFHRIPQAPPVQAQLGNPQSYQPAPPLSAFEPLPPQRIIAGFVGVLAMILMALMLIFGSMPGGMFDAVDQTRRLILAGFVSVLGFLLLLYANPRSRLPAVLIGGVLSAVLISLPLIFNKGTDRYEPEQATVPAPTTFGTDTDPESEMDPELARIQELRETIGLRPLEQEIERLEAADSPYKAYGLYLTGLQQSNRIAVRDFMFRVTNADPLSHVYPRDEDAYLFVITGLEMNIERLAALASPLGEVRRILPEIHLAEIAIDNSVFIESNPEKLAQRDDPQFYELNLRELRSIDLQRIERAVNRLADAKPRAYRADITQRLRELLDESGVDFHGTIARALAVWDTDTDRSAEIATQTALNLHNRGESAPPELVSLALKRPSEGMVDVLVSQWRQNVTMWENQCIAMGHMIEEAMIPEFEATEGARRQSAVRILSRTGGEPSRKALQNALDDADGELNLIIRQAIELIDDRMGES